MHSIPHKMYFAPLFSHHQIGALSLLWPVEGDPGGIDVSGGGGNPVKSGKLQFLPDFCRGNKVFFYLRPAAAPLWKRGQRSMLGAFKKKEKKLHFPKKCLANNNTRSMWSISTAAPRGGHFPERLVGRSNFYLFFLIMFGKLSSHQSFGTGMGSVGSGEERDIDMAPEMKSMSIFFGGNMM